MTWFLAFWFLGWQANLRYFGASHRFCGYRGTYLPCERLGSQWLCRPHEPPGPCAWYSSNYSSVRNRRACTFIDFEKKIPPARPYFALHVYCFWEKNPPTRLFSCISTGICPARLLILRKKSPLQSLIWVCPFNVFKNFSTRMFVFPYTSIRHTWVYNIEWDY